MASVKLSDVIRRANTKVDKNNTSLIYYVGGEHIESENILIEKRGLIAGSTIGPMFYYGFKAGDFLLVSRNPHLKKAGRVDFDGICSEKTFVLETISPEVLLPDFLPFILQNERFWEYAVQHKHGSINTFINWSTLADYEFELPDIDTQMKLAEVLWAIIDTMNAYKKLIIATDELVKSQFIEMTDGASLKRITDVCIKYGRGKTPSYVESSEIKVVNQACVYWDGLHLENVKYQNEDRFRYNNRLLPGTVLLNATGTGTLGRSYVFEEYDGTYMADSHIALFLTNPDLLLPRFLQVFFSLPETQKAIYADCVNGSTSQIELSKENIGEMLIPIPKLAKQKEFVSLAVQSDKSKFAAQTALIRIQHSYR